jgi:S1-C subfamily serine protease
VHLNDNRSFDATVVGRDPSTDLALLKIEATRLPTLEYGDSDAVRVGEWVLAVGNPMNLTSTVTAGIVSAKARTLNLLQYDPSRDIIPVESFIQTDAAVNPGICGGALVNTRGELVGINTAIQSSTGAFTGYSFAVPVNIVKKVTNDLLEYGTVQRAYIGVQIRNIDQELAAVLDLSPIRGVYVDGLVEDGAAREAGMAEGDVIVRVANVAVNTVPQLQEQVSRFRPGDRVNVTVLRDGRERTMNVVLKGRNGKTTLASGEANRVSNLLGAELVAASKDELKALDIEHGVKVRSLHAGKLRSSGVREGFIITRMDQEPVREPRDLDRLLAKKKGGVLIEGIYPNGTRAYYGMGL